MGVNTATDYGDGSCANVPGKGNSTVVKCSSSNPWMTAQAASADPLRLAVRDWDLVRKW